MSSPPDLNFPPTPPNGLMQVKCMHPHCFSVLGFLQQRIKSNSYRNKKCGVFITYQLNMTHTRCSYHHKWLIYHSSLIYATSATTCCTLHQIFTNTHCHGVLGNKAWEKHIGLTQTCLLLCNSNSCCICQIKQDSSKIALNTSQKYGKVTLPWTESKLRQTGNVWFFFSMGLKTLIFSLV